MSTPVYRGFDRAALDVAYDNRRAVPGHMVLREAWAPRAAAVYANVRCDRDVSYGPEARQRFDFFHCGRPGAPTFAWIHGGYWQLNDKEGQAFVGEAVLAAGVNFVLVEYTLAPAATMDRITGEIRAFVRHLVPRLGPHFGAGPRLVIGGHSEGGHLSAIAMEEPGVGGALLVSGLYDLEPIRLGKLNDRIGMSAEEAARNSPMLRDPLPVPAVVTVGGGELPELVRQSTEYAAYLRGKGRPVREIVPAGDNHFSILERIARPEGVLCHAVLELCGA
jgi:acetyl esterase/lipase